MSDRYTRHNYTKPVNTEPPSVEAIIVHRRELTHPWLQQAMEGIKGQTYPNLSLQLVHNLDMALTMGEALNQAVSRSEADLVLFCMEEDQLTWDTVQSMVDMYQTARKFEENVVHVTTYCTIVVDGAPGQMHATIHAPGLWDRKYLVEHPFDAALDAGVHQAKARTVLDEQRIVKKPLTMAFAHHHGYILRQHAFRGDGYQISIRR